MAHITISVEYGIHCLLFLVGSDGSDGVAMSSRELAELQGISPSFLAKIFPKLEKAGIVMASEGVRGGYKLARPAEQISFLDIIDAIEGEKPLFDCQDVRERCLLFGGDPPGWATRGHCSIHAVMLEAEKAMRDALAERTLAQVGAAFVSKAPETFLSEVTAWMGGRAAERTGRRGPGADAPG
jgi:Rrf2 family protein